LNLDPASLIPWLRPQLPSLLHRAHSGDLVFTPDLIPIRPVETSGGLDLGNPTFAFRIQLSESFTVPRRIFLADSLYIVEFCSDRRTKLIDCRALLVDVSAHFSRARI